MVSFQENSNLKKKKKMKDIARRGPEPDDNASIFGKVRRNNKPSLWTSHPNGLCHAWAGRFHITYLINVVFRGD